MAVVAVLAATPSPVVGAGQTAWFLPGALRTGDVVRCRSASGETDAKVPPVPASGTTTGTVVWKRAGPQMEIERHADGATQVTCAAPGPGLPRRPTPPYVIGQNGLGLIRGANTLGRLTRLYGQPSSTGLCRAAWKPIGLAVTFGGPRCDVLIAAKAVGPRWSSLGGVHVGDSVARMVWITQTRSRPVGGRIWVIGRGAQYRSELVALVGSKHTVVGFAASLKRPPSP